MATYKRPNGLLEVARRINGKLVHFYGYSQAEIERKMIEYTEERQRGRTYKEIADEWEDVHFPTLAYNSLKSLKPAHKRGVDYFGDRPINQIKAPDVKKFIVQFAHAKPGQKPRSKKTVITQLQAVNQVFSYACELGEIEYNPCTYVSIPSGLKSTRREAATTTDEEKVKNSPDLWLLPFLILYTGVRLGEALAIRDSDIKLKDEYINIDKSVYWVSNAPYIKEPKTEAGKRCVPILDPLKPMLKKKRGQSGYIFSVDGGKTPLTKSQFDTQWKQYVKDTGITCTPHQLRHSFATMLFENDVEVKDAQDMLGHATAAMTQDIYTHIRSTRRKRTAQLLNEKLSGKVTK